MNWFGIGAISAGIGVAIGAFGAHGLENVVSDPGRLETFETGARYQMYHALALLAVGWAGTRWKSPLISIAGWLFLVGTLIFSGSLYLLVLTDTPILGAVTPVGGVAFISGWIALGLGALRGR
ncbi:membrane protein [Acidobacteria bacterium Mor1]|nr:membrane protein [Acidobacteria bacterium Mor1]